MYKMCMSSYRGIDGIIFLDWISLSLFLSLILYISSYALFLEAYRYPYFHKSVIGQKRIDPL